MGQSQRFAALFFDVLINSPTLSLVPGLTHKSNVFCVVLLLILCCLSGSSVLFVIVPYMSQFSGGGGGGIFSS